MDNEMRIIWIANESSRLPMGRLFGEMGHNDWILR